MSNIKIIINGVERELDLIDLNSLYQCINGKWYREVEPVKPTYEILSFRYRELTWSKEKYYYEVIGRTLRTLLSDLLNSVKNGRATIHSVRRLTDGEVFTVGDEVINTREGSEILKIKSIHLSGGLIYLHDESGHSALRDLEKVKQPTILLTTEDGKEITNGKQYVYGINQHFKGGNIKQIAHI